MEIKRNGANGRRAQSVSYNGILYTSGITTTDLDADITGQTQDVIHIIDNILRATALTKRGAHSCHHAGGHGRLRRVQRRVGRLGRGRL